MDPHFFFTSVLHSASFQSSLDFDFDFDFEPLPSSSSSGSQGTTPSLVLVLVDSLIVVGVFTEVIVLEVVEGSSTVAFVVAVLKVDVLVVVDEVVDPTRVVVDALVDSCSATCVVVVEVVLVLLELLSLSTEEDEEVETVGSSVDGSEVVGSVLDG